jgi:hypothetical protein
MINNIAGGSPSSGGMTPEMMRKGQEAQAWNDQQEKKNASNLSSQTWGAKPGLGTPGSGLAAGGSVDLHDGDFILPADIVSAMGNGSTKAGAQFLDEFFGVS